MAIPIIIELSYLPELHLKDKDPTIPNIEKVIITIITILWNIKSWTFNLKVANIQM